MKVNSRYFKKKARLMRKKIKSWVAKKPRLNINQLAKKEQLRHAAILLLILGVSVAFYRFSTHDNVSPDPQEEIHFDGAFDAAFNKDSDEALIEKQQQELNELKGTVEENAKRQEEALQKNTPAEDTKKLIDSMQVKLERLESDNKKTNEQLQVALAMNAQGNRAAVAAHPPTREEQEARKIQRQHAEREIYINAGLETVHFNARKKTPVIERTAKNYVWAGAFFEGIMLTGLQGDAGINGSKNMGTALVRLTSNGIMPNEQRSHLEGCFVLVSTFGDLSASTVVLHVETVSCAGRVVNFEQKAYGAVYDLDAMQDLRGTSILKTKPLLGYTAAAGLLAGIGDGLKNYGTAESINSNGSVTLFSANSMGRSAAGGALSNPANRISEYIMKIADIYHPLVVARAGRRVSVMFTKGFWIDKEHQVYESGHAIDEGHDNKDLAVKTTVSRASNAELDNISEGQAIANNTIDTMNSNGAKEFIQQSNSSLPLFSTIENGVTPHD